VLFRSPQVAAVNLDTSAPEEAAKTDITHRQIAVALQVANSIALDHSEDDPLKTAPLKNALQDYIDVISAVARASPAAGLAAVTGDLAKATSAALVGRPFQTPGLPVVPDDQSESTITDDNVDAAPGQLSVEGNLIVARVDSAMAHFAETMYDKFAAIQRQTDRYFPTASSKAAEDPNSDELKTGPVYDIVPSALGPSKITSVIITWHVQQPHLLPARCRSTQWVLPTPVFAPQVIETFREGNATFGECVARYLPWIGLSSGRLLTYGSPFSYSSTTHFAGLADMALSRSWSGPLVSVLRTWDGQVIFHLKVTVALPRLIDLPPAAVVPFRVASKAWNDSRAMRTEARQAVIRSLMAPYNHSLRDDVISPYSAMYESLRHQQPPWVPNRQQQAGRPPRNGPFQAQNDRPQPPGAPLGDRRDSE
jgi:hypothetical protein